MNYHHNIWGKISHTIEPLTKLNPNKVKFKWTEVEQEVFEEIKRIVTRNVLLAYLGFNEEFKTHNDAIRSQSGAVIIQEGKPIAFYSIKLN